MVEQVESLALKSQLDALPDRELPRQPEVDTVVSGTRVRIAAQPSGLGALKEQENLHAGLFVAGKNVDSGEGHSILKRWSDQGHLIANHTWSHRVYDDSMDPDEFSRDMLRCDELVRSFPGFRPYFRFPALKEGSAHERRDRMRAFLREHGYRNGSATIDASDWYYDQRLKARLEGDRDFDVNRFRAPYLAHILNRAVYYDELARCVLGRTVRHTLLLHFNLLNSLFLPDLMKMFRGRGWQPVDAETAFGDDVFRRRTSSRREKASSGLWQSRPDGSIANCDIRE